MILWLVFIIGVTGQVDQHATTETKHLYNRLRTLARNENQILFGMQEATLQGVEGGHTPYIMNRRHDGVEGWIYGDYMVDQKYPDELCDVKRLTGSFPAVIGFDLYDLKDYQLKTTTFLGRKAYERGEVIALVMHHKNPITGGSPWIKNDKGDIKKSIKRLLPGGDSHWKWNQILDKIASWAHGFKDSKGTNIPVIFRFLHELNGDWFYWGLNNAVGNTEEELKEFYRYTVKYLRDTKGVHQFLYAFSPDKFTDQADYLKAYPGDNYVDILGMDYYYTRVSDTKDNLQRSIRDVVVLAESRNKIPALTETGYMDNKINQFPNFWTDYVLDVVKRQPTTKRLAYIHAWTNQCFDNAEHSCLIWVPYKGHPGANSFVNTFYKDPITIFGNKVPNFYH
ncbi:mannan endo-1,4-beta-mannosidase [Patella vulgata]|uniref:mannan endo-1,4-beta-mannosidase n=1 Tax=Patella vulgata TaxID=6465 RepID=UPI00218069D4|nr:mannan endo-1,4-beta-mannosidase [Patella vulgata]